MTTATDIAVVRRMPADGGRGRSFADAGLRAIADGAGGDAARAAGPTEEAMRVWVGMHASFEELIDRAKTSAAPVPVVVVGGGATLVGAALRGASKLVRPPRMAGAGERDRRGARAGLGGGRPRPRRGGAGLSPTPRER